jgi:hypothetical protein
MIVVLVGMCDAPGEEVTANATAADITLDRAQLDALTALPAGKDN